jgi:hypothetical protein
MKVTDLIKLGKKALKMFDEYVAEKSIAPPMRVYIRHFITDLEISEKGCRSQGSSEIIQKPDWAKIVFDFMEERVKPLPEFKQLIHTIAKRYKRNINKLAQGCNEESQSAFWLETFIQKLIYEKLENDLSEDTIIEYASLFKSELELSPSEYEDKHYLEGIFLESESIRINDDMIIRKTQKEDLEYTKDIFFDTPRPQYMKIPSAILETKVVAKDEREYHEYINRIFNSLRLYKLCSVYSIETIKTKKTAIWPGGLGRSWGHKSYSPFKKATIPESEIDTFVDFINIMEQKLNFDKEDKKYRTLYISLDRYNTALLEAIDVERKLMTAVMGLESIFTFEKDRGENAFKLSIRCAKLLGFMGFDVEKVRKLIEEAYSYRNKIVHGSYISQEIRRKMNEILSDILNYLRVSLIIFILGQETGKDEIVEMIDKSMISEDAHNNLKVLLEKNIGNFMEVLR